MRRVTILSAILAAGLFVGTAARGDEIAAAGSFYGAGGHSSRGEAALVRKPDGGSELRLENFSADRGPDLFIILSTATRPRDGRAIKRSEHVLLGRLGSGVYALPKGVDAGKFNSVGVWCRQYSVLFGAAPLNRK